MTRHFFILLMSITLVACATQGSSRNNPGSPAAVTVTPGLHYSSEFSSHSQGFVHGDGTIQRSTRVPGGYPWYHPGYPHRSEFYRQQHNRSEYHRRPRGRIDSHGDNLRIRGEW